MNGFDWIDHLQRVVLWRLHVSVPSTNERERKREVIEKKWKCWISELERDIKEDKDIMLGYVMPMHVAVMKESRF